MSNIILFPMPGNEALTRQLASILQAETGEATIRLFPDGESYVRILSDVSGKKVVVVCTLHHPNSKVVPLLFLAQTARELGAAQLCLLAPYLAYMRQDIRFKPGEAISSRIFAGLLSGTFDCLLTIDPHLHRFHSMRELYTIPATALHAAQTLADWVKANVSNPLLIGPDEESRQWVAAIAARANAPYLVLQKIRHGDKTVQVSLPEIGAYPQHTPVLADDIISTGHTMLETIHHLKQLTPARPVCLGIHAVFAPHAYQALQQAGAARIVTCNTIPHPSNAINIAPLLAQALQQL